jgi:peptide chain release factor 1
MSFDKKDVIFKYKRGSGPGGQHRNKTDSCVVATHVPTGLKVTIDGRDQHKNKSVAIREIENLVYSEIASKAAKEKKSDRDFKIHNTKIIRTYNFKRNKVKDHRSKKTANLTKMLEGKVNFSGLSK